MENSKIKSQKSKIILFVVIVAVLIGAGLWYASGRQQSGAKMHAHETHKTIYYCPMHPNYTSDRPGECPICGMTLVPMKQEETPQEKTGQERAAVAITPDRQQLIGVKKATITIMDAVKTIRAVAKVAFDPELAVAQREYIEAIKLGDRSLSDAARQRLILMGMGADQIKELARTRKVQEGLYAQGKTAWVYPVIYEYELPFASAGQTVTIELPSGGTTREGIVRAIDPVVDQATRTARIRIEVSNEDGALKPNMFVNAIISKDLGRKLLVPKDAVIDSGERKIVFIIHEGTHFMPQEVKLGAELSDYYVVESGLNEGDEVATSANFLIDAESKLKAALGGTTGHQHGN